MLTNRFSVAYKNKNLFFLLTVQLQWRVGVGRGLCQVVGGEFGSDLLHTSLVLHVLSSRQTAEVQEPKLNSVVDSEPPLMSRLLIFRWKASHIAKPNISEVGIHTPPTLVSFYYTRDCRSGNSNSVYPNMSRGFQSINLDK